MHEDMQDEMMFALMLRKQHEMVMALLEEIFVVVLTFAKKERGCIGEDINENHKNFAKKIRDFVEICRGLSERKALPNGDLVEDDGIARLLLKLEISGYYSNGDG